MILKTSPRLLIIDDDAAFCAELCSFLELYGYQVRAALSADDLAKELSSFEPDLVLLDQRLGVTTGTDVLRALRGQSDVPCIVITGLPNETDRVVNLEIGADDEVDKSIAPRELIARIRAVMRRRQNPSPAAHLAEGPDRMGWRLLLQRRELWRPNGTLCPLTSAEFDALALLHKFVGKPVSREMFCEVVFGRPFQAGDRSVDTVVAKLRRKLTMSGLQDAIKTVRSAGYVFVGFENPEESL